MRERLQSHFKINTRLSMFSDRKLSALLSKSNLTKRSAQNGIIDLDGQKVFVKKIPITVRELENAYSTKNHYRIPTWYNYGIGSYGFGAYRELAAHIKTTNWVREAQFTGFPLLHHYRILPTTERSQNISGIENYVSYWNGSKTIERYMLDRNECTQHLVLFLEHFTPASELMTENPAKLNALFPKAIECIDFLNQNGFIHFDAHIYNWLTDGRNLYLTDFGLVLDKQFELSKSEQQFFNQHRRYDYSQVVETFGYAMMESYLALNEDQEKLVTKALEEYVDSAEPYLNLVIRTALTLHETNKIRLPSTVKKYIQRYQPVINAKNDFFKDMRFGKKASDKFPARKMANYLKQLQVT